MDLPQVHTTSMSLYIHGARLCSSVELELSHSRHMSVEELRQCSVANAGDQSSCHGCLTVPAVVDDVSNVMVSRILIVSNSDYEICYHFVQSCRCTQQPWHLLS